MDGICVFTSGYGVKNWLSSQGVSAEQPDHASNAELLSKLAGKPDTAVEAERMTFES
jgi:hypothetical protein